MAAAFSRFLGIAVIGAVLLIFTSCIEMDYEIHINADGSARVVTDLIYDMSLMVDTMSSLFESFASELPPESKSDMGDFRTEMKKENRKELDDYLIQIRTLSEIVVGDTVDMRFTHSFEDDRGVHLVLEEHVPDLQKYLDARNNAKIPKKLPDYLTSEQKKELKENWRSYIIPPIELKKASQENGVFQYNLVMDLSKDSPFADFYADPSTGGG